MPEIGEKVSSVRLKQRRKSCQFFGLIHYSLPAPILGKGQQHERLHFMHFLFVGIVTWSIMVNIVDA